MQIFVINLEKDTERRESIRAQLDDLKLAFELLPGVLGAELSAMELSKCYDERKAKRYLCMPLVPAHIGCSLSHTRVYREIIRRNLPCALILEDDVILPESLPGLLADLQRIANYTRPEVILLSPAEGVTNPRGTRPLTGSHELLPFKHGYYTSSYIINNLGARALFKELYPVGDYADCWDRMSRYKVVDIFVVSPPLIAQDQNTFGSSTNEDTLRMLANMGFGKKLILKVRRAWSKVLDFFYAWYRRHRHPYAGIIMD